VTLEKRLKEREMFGGTVGKKQGMVRGLCNLQMCVGGWWEKEDRKAGPRAW